MLDHDLRLISTFFLLKQYKVDITKIDWHDWEFIAKEQKRTGPGEQGKSVSLSSDEQSLSQKSYDSNGFSGFVSDKIDLDRAVKDIRHPLCHGQQYVADLPGASIIIPYFNEHWTTLMRTVHSVVNRSPPELIVEIILVDDASTKEHCKEPVVEDYLKKQFPRVSTNVIHLEGREGLIGARLAVARAAKGQVLLFLDSHTEANINWLPPLLEPIAINPKTAVAHLLTLLHTIHSSTGHKTKVHVAHLIGKCIIKGYLCCLRIWKTLPNPSTTLLWLEAFLRSVLPSSGSWAATTKAYKFGVGSSTSFPSKFGNAVEGWLTLHVLELDMCTENLLHSASVDP